MGELHGILIPCFEEHDGRIFHFKLGTASQELFLDIPLHLLRRAQAAGWAEVKVRAKSNVDTHIAAVEELSCVDGSMRAISKDGKVQPGVEMAM